MYGLTGEMKDWTALNSVPRVGFAGQVPCHRGIRPGLCEKDVPASLPLRQKMGSQPRGWGFVFGCVEQELNGEKCLSWNSLILLNPEVQIGKQLSFFEL